MKSSAACSVHCDPWKAGFEVGERLAPDAPEVIFLFCSIHYEADFPSLFEGLREGLGGTAPIVFGCTGDGVFDGGTMTHVGVTAMGLASAGQVRWSLHVMPEAGDGGDAAQRCATNVAADLGGPPDLAFLVADGTRADGARLVEGATAVLTCPLLGGLAGDDRQFRRSYVFANGRAWTDAVAILGARGKVRFAMHAASGFRPLGDTGQVDDSEGNEVRRIDGKTAQGFLREQLGKAPGEADFGVVPLAIKAAGGHYLLRTPAGVDSGTGAVRAFGAVPQGSEVRVCAGSLDDVLAGVDEVLDRTDTARVRPDAVLVVSCAGRKWLLGDRYGEEVERLRAHLGRDVPMVGFLSFGEIGPFRENGGHSPSHFHNATVVMGVLGD